MRPPIHDCFGAPPATLPPSTLIRRWDEALLLGGFLAVCVYVGLGLLLWRDWSWFGPKPAVAFRDYISAAFHLQQSATLAPGVTARAVVMLAGACVLGALGFHAGLRPQSRIRHVGGPRLLEGREALRAGQRIAAAECGKREPWFALHPQILVDQSRFSRHFLLIGGTGSGKTNWLVGMLSAAMRRPDVKIVAYDVKGDLTQRFKNAVILSPWDIRSRYWSVGLDVQTESQIATLVNALIPLRDSNPFFPLAARQLCVGCLLALRSERGSGWGWQDFAEKLASDLPTFAKMLQEHNPGAAALVADEDSQAASGVLATLISHVSLVQSLAKAWGNGEGMKRVSFRHWLRDDYPGRTKIILQGGPDAELTRAYVGAIVDLLAGMIITPAFTESRDRKIMIVLDELPSLGRLTGLTPLLDKSRSKSCCVICAVQDLALLRESMGSNQTEAMTSLVGTTLVFRTQMSPSVAALSDLFGKERIAIPSQSGAPGTTALAVHEEQRAVVPPHVITSELGVQTTKDGFSIKAIVAGLGPDALMLEWPGLDLPQRQPAFIPSDWARGRVRTTTVPTEPVAPEIAPEPAPTPAVEAPPNALELYRRKVEERWGLKQPRDKKRAVARDVDIEGA
jgi:hypothetical protein